ncbi:hypothetical protein C8R47DRAFT_5028 [Mycena vitilis]|nr:hypothetical protein C8R47DRAFT_5028 [Mycena vitilis]
MDDVTQSGRSRASSTTSRQMATSHVTQTTLVLALHQAPFSLRRTTSASLGVLLRTSPTIITLPRRPSRIPLGDIDLGDLRLERASGRFVRERQSTCRVYAARVEGRTSRVTVAIYEGNGAKEKWREDIYHYSSLRHPNFVQLWGVTTSSRIHAAIFHDDLIPFRHFRDLHEPVLAVYIYAYVAADYWVKESGYAGNCI